MNSSFLHNGSFSAALSRIGLRRGLAFGLLIVGALIAFEIFNFSTTVFALTDLLGDLDFAGIKWATILALAFCSIDFAGIARLFTPETGDQEPNEVWYLFGAWLLAATMNAMLTWWGVSIALLNHDSLGNAVVSRETLIRIVPIFVAALVWLIRVLIIGTFSVAGDRLFSQADRRPSRFNSSRTNNRTITNQTPVMQTQARNARPSMPSNTNSGRVPYTPANQQELPYTRPEPTYHPVNMSASQTRGNGSNRGTVPTRR
jgi:hypothetical protein